jgi:hypothetical protein
LQRLAQIMAGGGQKAGFGDIGAFGLQFGRFKSAGGGLAFGNVGKGDDDPFDPAIARAIGEYAAQEPFPARPATSRSKETSSVTTFCASARRSSSGTIG